MRAVGASGWGERPAARYLSARRRRSLTPYLFAAPAVIFVFVGTVFMTVYAIYISFTEYQLQLGGSPRFVGLKNYAEALRDARFWKAIYQTALIALPALALEFALGLALALLLNRSFRGRAIAVSLMATPVMISPAAAGMAFRLLYEPRYGAINDILSRISGRTVQIEWLGAIGWVRPALIFTDVWHMSPFVMLLLLAGLANISDDIFHAARVDGATAVQIFTDVTIPLLKPVLILILLLRGIELFRLFDFIYIMTKGGPGTSTQTISYYIYQNGLQFFRVGYGSAMAWIIAIFTIFFSRYYFQLVGRKGA